MKNRGIAILLILALALSASACGNTAPTEAQPQQAEAEAAETPAPTPEATAKPSRAEQLLEKAQAGDGRSYTDLGKLYETGGSGVEQDYEKALECYRLSAEAEKPDFKGMRLAGLMYMDGRGVEQDYAEAAACFEIAANAGDVSAAYFLGVLYEEGKGVEQSAENAKLWYEKAVSTVDEFLANTRNNGPDELKLALCKLAELALAEEDTETAIQYYQYAAELGWSEAQDKLTELGVTG